MVKLNLEIDDEKREFNIPNSWDEVDVETYSKIAGIDQENLTDIEISVKSISILTGIDEDLIYMMSPDEFNQVADIVKFTNEEIKGDEVDSITIDGEEYFIKKDFNKLTMGEVISLELIIEKSGDNVASMMAEMLCIFLRKKKENGELETFKKSFMDRAEIFKKAKISEVNDLLLFFSDGENSYINSMKVYSEEKRVKKELEMIKKEEDSLK